MAQIQAYASGTIRVHPSTGRDCFIDTAILQALKIVVVDRGFALRVSSLNRYCENQLTGSGTSSYHWRDRGGHAIDIDRVNGVNSTGNTAQDRALIQSMYTALPGPAGLGQMNCHGSLPVPSGWVQFNDSCNHNHFEYRGGPVSVPLTDLDRSFSITTSGQLQAKAGMYDPVVTLRNDTIAVDTDGTTTAAVDSAGNVWVQQGGFSNEWVGLMNGAKDVAVDGERFVVLLNDGTVLAKDGLYSTNWTTQLTGATDIDADASRIGVLASGILYVKEGNLWESWTNQSTNVTDFALDGTRIGIVSGGTAFVKEGNLWTDWVPMLPGSRIELEGNRVAVLGNDGAVVVKEGNLWESWQTLTGPGVSDLALSGSRIAVVSGGSVLIKSGALNAGWIGAYSGSKAVDLS